MTVGRPGSHHQWGDSSLDVPPEMYQGVVVVPIRVISEGMGAYVEWEADKHLVVVRYLPPTPPPPAPAATPAPTMAPTAAPTAKPVPYQEVFIVGDYLFSPKIYNEFSPGNTGSGSYTARAGWEFSALNIPWMVEADYRDFGYPHHASAPTFNANGANVSCPGNPGCVTVDRGGLGQTYVPAFTARDTEEDFRLGVVRVANPRVYVGVGYLLRSDNYAAIRGLLVGAMAPRSSLITIRTSRPTGAPGTTRTQRERAAPRSAQPDPTPYSLQHLQV